jgi:hypothetical protein
MMLVRDEPLISLFAQSYGYAHFGVIEYRSSRKTAGQARGGSFAVLQFSHASAASDAEGIPWFC